MAKLIDTDTVSWLSYVKPLIWDEPWNEANEILKKEDYFYATLGRCNGKRDALDAMVNAVKAYEKVKKEEEMENEGILVIDLNDIRKFNITYPYPGIPMSTTVKGIATIELEMAAGTIDKIRKSLKGGERARVREYVASRPNGRNRPEIEKVIFNPPATIVIWYDKSKTVVKCRDVDEYDPEYGLAMCIAKKYFGSRHQMQKLVVENYEEPDYTNIDPDSNALKEDCNDAKDENKTTDSSVNSGNPNDHWDSDKVWGQTE